VARERDARLGQQQFGGLWNLLADAWSSLFFSWIRSRSTGPPVFQSAFIHADL